MKGYLICRFSFLFLIKEFKFDNFKLLGVIKYLLIFKFKSNKEYKWIHISDIDKFGLPKPIKSIMDRL